MSKGLEALEKIKKEHYVDGRLPLIDRVRIDIIEKELKALDIIKVFFKGRFNLHESKYIKDEQGNYGYVHFISFDEKYSHIRYPISQEEYDLLKEVLS